jgi:hypothetical protein
MVFIEFMLIFQHMFLPFFLLFYLFSYHVFVPNQFLTLSSLLLFSLIHFHQRYAFVSLLQKLFKLSFHIPIKGMSS